MARGKYWSSLPNLKGTLVEDGVLSVLYWICIKEWHFSWSDIALRFVQNTLFVNYALPGIEFDHAKCSYEEWNMEESERAKLVSDFILLLWM